eukprot:Gb_34578 [translate_table: standard]
MAFQCSQNLDDGELWLPSDFLSDESPPKERLMQNNNKPQFPYEFPYEWSSFGLPLDSSYNSPVESVVGSTETESDEEDDYMAGLAQQIAHSMLDDDENNDMKQTLQWASRQKTYANPDSNKSTILARSPQSTLSAVGSWSACSLGSGNSTGSSKGPSQVSSPPTTPLTEQSDAWDLLYAAAGEVVRLKMSGAKATPPNQMHAQGVLGPARREVSSCSQSATFLHKDLQPRSRSFAGFPSKDKVNSSQALQRSWSDKAKEEDRRLSANQYRQPKPSQVSGWGRQVKPAQFQHLQSRPGNKSGAGNRTLRTIEFSTPPWTPMPQTGGSGMRAVFLGSNSGRESGGTGVFLPRRMGSNSDLRRKPACSTVLLPSRIVQALNLNVEDISSQPNTQFAPQNQRDVLTSLAAAPSTTYYGGRPVEQHNSVPRNAFSEHQKTPCYPVCPQIQAASSDISLPKEWTY